MDQIDKNRGTITVKCKNFNEGFSGSGSLIFPSVTERVRKLEEQQIIEGYHAHVSLKNKSSNFCTYTV